MDFKSSLGTVSVFFFGRMINVTIHEADARESGMVFLDTQYDDTQMQSHSLRVSISIPHAPTPDVSIVVLSIVVALFT